MSSRVALAASIENDPHRTLMALGEQPAGL